MAADRPLAGRRIAFLVANEGVEQVELTHPWGGIEDQGGDPVLVAPSSDPVQAFKHLDKADTFPPDVTLGNASVDDFDGLVLPGGVANPDQLRTDERAISFVREFVRKGKPVAVICHGPWTLVEADVLQDRTVTSWPSLQTDIRNAGGTWVDEEVVLDETGPGPLVSSRKPDDLPRFTAMAVSVFAGT